MKIMAAGAAVVARQLYDDGKLAGIIGMGGSGGTSVITSAMRALPTGVPKVCVTTVAGRRCPRFRRDERCHVDSLRRRCRRIESHFADDFHSRCRRDRGNGASRRRRHRLDDRPVIAASMFGNTTQCVDSCRELLEAAGYEVLTFHATGVGGRTMESLIDEGFIDACLDITTTEWADQLCGGVFSAGEDRLSAPGRRGIPHLIVPGCIDMVNFGPPETVPQKYRDAGRKFYEWNPAVTLMRTNVEENRRLGEIFAEKANVATGPTAF